MNIIFSAIGFIILGIIVSYIFGKVRNSILKRVTNIVKPKLNAIVGNVYKPDGQEIFQWKKFRKIFDLFNGLEWIKSIKEIIDMRKLVIYSIIVGVIFAYGWYQGKQGTPVQVDIGYGKEAVIKLNGNFLRITKEGYVYVEDEEGNKIKQLSVKDIPALKRKLAPFGIQFEPILVTGIGVSDFGKSGGEVGAGISWLRCWQARVDSFLTQRGVYPLGASYKLEGLLPFLKNSRIGIGAGKGWQGDNRGIIYFAMPL